MTDDKPNAIDRLAARTRPEGRPLMRQTWGKLLFMHWRIDAALLRPLIPERLHVDTFDGSAWIAVAPFTMWDVRLSFAPAVPGLSSLHELNVRTYVHADGVPGVWFLSLDADSRAAVAAARTFYHLPYFNASIDLQQRGDRITYDLARTDEPPAEFHATYRGGGNARFAQPDTLEFFLVERYCLYASAGDRLLRARIYHEPWPLRDAALESLDSTMIESHGLPTPKGDPLLHYAEELDVDIWGPEEV